MALTETNLTPAERLKLPGYRWIGKNRINKEGGGVGLLIKNAICKNIVIEPTTDTDLETIWITTTLIDQTRLCIGTYYGKQESRCTVQQIKEEFESLQNTITGLLVRHNHILLIGDFNAKIGNDADGIPGNHPVISRNGHLLRNTINLCNLDILNRQTVCKGLWTRVNTRNKEEKSVLDYALCTKTLTPYITKMTIDEDEHHRLTGKSRTDHNTFLITLATKPQDVHLQPNTPTWQRNNINWDLFSKCMDTSLRKLSVNPDKSTTELYTQWLEETIRIAHQVVGKSKGQPCRDASLQCPEVKLARQHKRDARKSYENTILTGHSATIKTELKRYRQCQSDVINAINIKLAEIAENKLKKIMNSGGVNSKQFWNIRRQTKNNNLGGHVCH